MEGFAINGPRIVTSFSLFGMKVVITETVTHSFYIVVFVFLLCLLLTHKMEKLPRKKTQVIAEWAVTTVDNLVENTMGKSCKKYSPYIMALLVSSALGSLISLTTLRSTTADLNTTITWAALTFLLIQYNGLRTKGLGGYVKSFFEPVPFLVPLNIISEFSTPLSMAFRQFGNIAAGMVITGLLYGALAAFTNMLFHIGVPILQIGLPALLSVYFDLFTGLLQAFIFSMLTMVFISNARDEEPDAV